MREKKPTTYEYKQDEPPFPPNRLQPLRLDNAQRVVDEARRREAAAAKPEPSNTGNHLTKTHTVPPPPATSSLHQTKYPLQVVNPDSDSELDDGDPAPSRNGKSPEVVHPSVVSNSRSTSARDAVVRKVTDWMGKLGNQNTHWHHQENVQKS